MLLVYNSFALSLRALNKLRYIYIYTSMYNTNVFCLLLVVAILPSISFSAALIPVGVGGLCGTHPLRVSTGRGFYNESSLRDSRPQTQEPT